MWRASRGGAARPQPSKSVSWETCAQPETSQAEPEQKRARTRSFSAADIDEAAEAVSTSRGNIKPGTINAMAEEYKQMFQKKAEAGNSNVEPREEAEADKAVRELEAALKSGELDVKSDQGQKFGRWTRKDIKNKEEYEKFCADKQKDGTTKNAAKAAFRLTWASRELEQAKSKVEGKSWSHTFQKVDREKGKMKCFAVLVESMGYNYDPEGAVRRATEYSPLCF